MEKRWARKLAILLALCLLVNNCIEHVPMVLHASEGSPSSLSVTSGDAEDEQSGNGSADGGDDQSKNSSADDEDDQSENDSVDDVDGQNTTSTESDETVQSEASENSIALLSESDDTVSDSDLGGIPKKVDAYLEARDGKDTFYITSYDDFIAVQNLCKDSSVNGFKDTTLVIIDPPTGQVWNLNEYSEFEGIGTDTSPFQGTIKCYYAITSQSVQFNLATPLFAYLGTGAKVQQLDLVMDGAHAAIAENIVGDVTISDILLSGTIENTDEDGAAGIIAATIADYCSITLANVRSNETMEVSGAIAGGIAGTVGSNVNVTFQDDSSLASSSLKAEVKGTTAAGGHYGTVTGICSWNLADESKIATSVVANGASCYAGQFAGKLLSTSQLNITGGDSDSVTVDVSGTGNGGGLVGLCGANTKIVKPDGTFTIEGTVSMKNGYVGGVAACFENTTMELSGYTINAAISGTGDDCGVGGIAGQILGGKYIIKNAIINGSVTGEYMVGGLVGWLSDETKKDEVYIAPAAVELQGNIAINSTPAGGSYVGQVVGRQHKCLIYFSEVGKPEEFTSPAAFTAPNSLEEIGKYGGIYRNHQLTENIKLIGDGTLEKVGVINNSITKTGTAAAGGGIYQLTSAADFETLAIAFGTEGNFGEFGPTVFGGVQFDKDTTPSLLLRKSEYVVTESVDISYETTGIITLNRNDSDDYYKAFSGSMKGVDDTIIITQNCSERQSRVGLFSGISAATFENLTLDGTIENAAGAGGIAYQIVDDSNHQASLILSNVTMEKVFKNNSYAIGGVVAKENCSNAFTLTTNDLTLASTINAGSVEDFSGFITSMDNATVSMTDTVLGGSITSSASASSLGGFMGRSWTNIAGIEKDGIVNSEIVNGVTVQSGTTYESAGKFGAFWGKLSNAVGEYLTIQNVALDGLTVNVTGKYENCSLMIQDATALVVNVVDYNSKGCTVNNPYNHFDEIAGQTKASGYGLAVSGIVSIHSSTANYPAYHYENKATNLTSVQNTYTMYFYDVFQLLENADGTTVKFDKKLDTLNEMLIWDLIHYANSTVQETILRRYLADYTANAGYVFWNEDYTFSGTLDLSQISFYPVINVNGKYQGEEGTVIKFDASVKDASTVDADGNSVDGIAMNNWSLNNISKISQHYGLQAGLFYNPSHLQKFDNITFTGYIANLGVDSGVLACGNTGISRGTITNVTLDNLWILDYSESIGAGLLISHIPGSKNKDDTSTYGVSFDGITMTNYSPTTEGQKHAAAALIGSAGGTEVVDLSLDFHNMVIADDIDDKDVAAQHNGTVLAYASFIYSYTYTDVASDYEGHGIYLFSEADSEATSPKKVTYGVEIDDYTEFSDTSNLVIIKTGINPSDYKPYVYQTEKTKKIEVNPKSGDILKGCGTYEDPYIIENARQLLTLYRYINETGSGTTTDPYQYQAFYEGWKVIGAGDDSEFCTTKHRVEADTSGNLSGTGVSDVKIFGTSTDFPTPDELSRAYYQLGADIDLSQSMGTTYDQVAADFVGFGTEERPFVGVWSGKDQEKDENGKDVIHTITLPNKKTTAQYATYGFIQYAKGAVVKDMNIETSQNTTNPSETAAQITSTGGGVIACILGGDNIIDNVTVDVDYNLSSAYAVIGGYVGKVVKGGLILRNVSDNALANFNIYANSGDYGYLGTVVGKVEDGYVLYEGNENPTSPLWSIEQSENHGNITYNGETKALVEVVNYDILDGKWLKEHATGLDVEKEDASDTISNITITIPTEEALQVMSMALNSDALNVVPSDYSNYTACGYTENSRSRKADYSDIGNCTAQSEDYISAAKYDNVMNYTQGGYSNAQKAYAYPYLYQYMGITGDDTDSSTKKAYYNYLVEYNADTDSDMEGYSVLNPAIVINGTSYIVQWELAANSTYDMSKFDNSFRGLGALYQPGASSDGKAYGGAFNGNFNGNASTININMCRRLIGSDSWNGRLAYAGLFNVLYGRETSLYQKTANFADVGATVEKNLSCAEIKDFTLTGTITVNKGAHNFNVGGVAGLIYYGSARYIFDSITVDNFQVVGNSGTRGSDGVSYVGGGINHVGGIVGYIGINTNVLIQDCNIGSESESDSETRAVNLNGESNIGGLVGMTAATILKIKSSSAKNMALRTVNDNVGGLVGWQAAGNTQLIFEGTETNKCSVTNSDLHGYLRAGGLLGGTADTFSMSYVFVENLTLEAYRNIGGIVGNTENDASATTIATSIIKNVTVKDICTNELSPWDVYVNGIGGVVGRNEQILTIKNATVTGTKTEKGYQCKLHACTDKPRTGSSGVGGIVGVHTYTAEPSVSKASTVILTMIDCSVDTISIEADVSKTITDKNYPVNIGAGGLVGYTKAYIKLDGEISTQNLNVKAPLRSESAETILAAGGCFGCLYSHCYLTGVNSAYHNGLLASQNTVTGKQAGGVIGYVSSTYNNVRLAGITVQDGTVASDEIAGGVFGYISPAPGIGAALDSLSYTVTNTVNNMNISARMAGGVIGKLLGDGPIRIEALEVNNNTIVGEQTYTGEDYSAGGVIGSVSAVNNNNRYIAIYNTNLNKNIIACEVDDTTLSSNEVNHLAAGGIVGRMCSNSTTYYILCDNIEIASDNQIGVRKAASATAPAGDVKLVTYVNGSYQLTDLSMPQKNDVSTGDATHYEALEKLTEDYGYYVGNMVGVVQSTNMQFYLLRSTDKTNGTLNKFETPVLTKNPPVIDVGRTSGQEADDYRQYCHIIYGADVDTAKVAADNLADMKEELKNVKSQYEGTEGTEILKEYRLPQETIELFDKLYSENGYVFSENAKIDFPILVWKAEYGTIQDAMECIVNVMTNVAGASASDVGSDYLYITCEQKLYDYEKNETTTSEGTASITAVTENGETTYSSSVYDGLVGSKLSYTEITFNYDVIQGTKNDQNNKVFKIPIFVEEPILYGVHSMIVEGRVTDVDTVKEKGISESSVTNSSLIMANDSDYTMLLEYTYGEARKNMPGEVCVDKFFSLEALGEKQIPEGTRLMLIDVTDGNKAYYYTVQYIKDENGNETLPSKVFFSEFQNSAGEYYQSQSINQLEDVTTEGKDCYIDLEGHELTKVGVEQFLLTVLAAENSDNQVYTIHTGIYVEDESLASRFDTWKDTEEAVAHNEQSSISVTAIPGLTIAFKDKGTDENKDNELTDIEGFISKDGNLNIKANIEIKAEDGVYWAKKQQIGSGTPIIDSENNGKYLELAFYLRDKDGNRVKFPTGTNFSYMLAMQDDNTVSYSENKIIPNDSVFYYYKDVLSSFNQDYQYQIGNLDQDTTIYVEFMMDFSGADLSNITDEKYVAWLDLLRTANRNYPMGNGNKLDSYSEEVDANASQQLGFAVKAQDLNQLAINTYPEAAETNTINYSIMFDFSDLLKQSTGIGLDALKNKWAGYDYTVTYEVYKKTDNGTYERYQGDDIVLYGDMTKDANGNYDVSTATTKSSAGAMTVQYNFTADQLGTNDGYISLDGNAVIISTAKLIGESTEASTGDLTNLTNYKIKATLVITASETESAPTTTDTSDFFIYTVTKLKTDL